MTARIAFYLAVMVVQSHAFELIQGRSLVGSSENSGSSAPAESYSSCGTCVSANYAWAAGQCNINCYQIMDVGCDTTADGCQVLEDTTRKELECGQIQDCEECVDSDCW